MNISGIGCLHLDVGKKWGGGILKILLVFQPFITNIIVSIIFV